MEAIARSSLPSKAAPLDPPAGHRAHAAARRITVLVVDDDPSFSELVERYLTLAGYGVCTARDGDEALDVASRLEPHVVLADLHMPRLGGLGLARELREQNPDAQVVLMTSQPSLMSAAAAVELRASRYLIKPFRRNDLLAAVERAAEDQHRIEENRSALRVLEAMRRDQRQIAELDRTLEEAVQGLWMAYQPVVGARDGSLFGYEALLRTTDARMSSPAAVLGAAEQLGKLHTVGGAARSCAAEPFLKDSSDTAVLVNLHASDLADDALFDRTAPLSRIAHRVFLEITERASLESVADFAERVERLRAMGFRFAIDDLGAGYSALATLATLEPEVVKLDMELARGVHESGKKRVIVRHLVEMAHDAGALTVAEGVERVEERDTLADLGCDLLQGYLIGRPERMPQGT